jgi:hypothetical protein
MKYLHIFFALNIYFFLSAITSIWIADVVDPTHSSMTRMGFFIFSYVLSFSFLFIFFSKKRRIKSDVSATE